MSNGPVVEISGPNGRVTIPIELLRRKSLSEVSVFLSALFQIVSASPGSMLLEMPMIARSVP